MSNVSSDLLEKLSALLRKTTENGCTPQEAEAAMAAAQRIAAKNNVDLANLQDSADAVGQGGAIKVEKSGLDSERCKTRRPHHRPIAFILMECFDVKFVWHGNGPRCTIVGEKTDVALASYCWTWLDGYFPKLYLAYLKERGIARTPLDTNNLRASFYTGVGEGIRRNNRRIRDEAKAEGGNRYALVLVQKDALVTQTFDKLFPKLKSGRASTMSLNASAYYAGKQVGSNIKLGHALQ